MPRFKTALFTLVQFTGFFASIAAAWFSGWLMLLANFGGFNQLDTQGALGISPALYFVLLFAFLALAWLAIAFALLRSIGNRLG